MTPAVFLRARSSFVSPIYEEMLAYYSNDSRRNASRSRGPWDTAQGQEQNQPPSLRYYSQEFQNRVSRFDFPNLAAGFLVVRNIYINTYSEFASSITELLVPHPHEENQALYQ